MNDQEKIKKFESKWWLKKIGTPGILYCHDWKKTKINNNTCGYCRSNRVIFNPDDRRSKDWCNHAYYPYDTAESHVQVNGSVYIRCDLKEREKKGKNFDEILAVYNKNEK